MAGYMIRKILAHGQGSAVAVSDIVEGEYACGEECCSELWKTDTADHKRTGNGKKQHYRM